MPLESRGGTGATLPLPPGPGTGARVPTSPGPRHERTPTWARSADKLSTGVDGVVEEAGSGGGRGGGRGRAAVAWLRSDASCPRSGGHVADVVRGRPPGRLRRRAPRAERPELAREGAQRDPLPRPPPGGPRGDGGGGAGPRAPGPHRY